MLKTPTRVSVNSPMPTYNEKQDHKSYAHVGDFKDTLPRAPKGTLRLGSARSLGAFSNVPRLNSPPNWAYRTMIPAEKRLSNTWTRDFMEDSMFSFSGPPFITYADAIEPKKWNAPRGYYERESPIGVAREYFTEIPEATVGQYKSRGGKVIPPFGTSLSDTAIVAARPKSNPNLGDIWSDITSAGNTLLKTAEDIYSTYQAGQISKAQAEIAQATAQAAQASAAQVAKTKSTLWSYFPWIIGLGGGALLLSVLLKRGRG